MREGGRAVGGHRKRKEGRQWEGREGREEKGGE